MTFMDRLVKIDRWLSKKSKSVTKAPVYLKLVKYCRDTKTRRPDKKAAAQMVKYPRKKGVPLEYEIQFKESYYKRNNKKPSKIKKIISHELAHIKYNTHGPKWAKTARRLGAGEYATAVGTTKKPKTKKRRR